MAKIRIKRGLQSAVSNLVLDVGEMAVATDTGNVYVGVTSGVVHINPSGGIADTAQKLQTPRNFSITGDGSANAQSFDGSANVILDFVLNTVSGLSAGTYTKLTVDTKGRVTAGAQLTVSDIPTLTKSKISDMPTKVSQFTNDSGFQTAAQVTSTIAALVGSAPETLNTLNELAAALGNDPNFATTITAALGERELLLSKADEATTIADDDSIPFIDTSAGNIAMPTGTSSTRKLSLTNLKANLKTYFDTLYNKYTHPTYTSKTSGLYKVTVDSTGHVSAATAVAKSDITGLGIPAQDTVYTLPNATSSTLGGVKIGTGISVSSGTISLPAATTSSIGGVKIGDGISVSSGTISVGEIDGGTF
jgi:hypothetical protein